MSGLYLAIATLAFGSIVGTVFQKWTAVTGGFDGFAVPTPYIFGIPIEGATGIYYVSLVVLVFVLWLSANLLRSPIGRAMVAIRDSEISAQSMGIHLARYKTLAFAISAGMTGLAGALFAHYVRFLAPDAFDVLLSVQFVTIVFVGGLGSLHGAILGAIFVRLLPQVDRHRARRSAVRHRPPAGPGAVAVRPGAGAGDPVPARRHERPVAEDRSTGSRPIPLQTPRPASAGRNPMRGRSGCDEPVPAPTTSRSGSAASAPSTRSASTCEQGEVFSIIGPNGAGKTTIFNLISRIYQPTTGRLIFEDQDITDVPPHRDRRPGHRAHVPEHRTVRQRDAAAEPADRPALPFDGRRSCRSWRSCPSARRAELQHREKVEDVIAFLGLQRYRDTLIANLPYGVRKVVELGRALCIEPKLLLLDEPSSGLNVEETEGMGFWIEDIKKDLGITVIMVEHDMTLVTQVSDRVMALNYGKVIAMGTPQEVQTHPEVVRAYIGGEA